MQRLEAIRTWQAQRAPSFTWADTGPDTWANTWANTWAAWLVDYFTQKDCIILRISVFQLSCSNPFSGKLPTHENKVRHFAASWTWLCGACYNGIMMLSQQQDLSCYFWVNRFQAIRQFGDWTVLDKSRKDCPTNRSSFENACSESFQTRAGSSVACSWRREENTCLQDKQASAKNLSDMILRLGSVGSHLIAFYESSCMQGKQTYPCLRLCLCLGHFCQALRKLNCFQQTEPLDGKMLRLLRKTRED